MRAKVKPIDCPLKLHYQVIFGKFRLKIVIFQWKSADLIEIDPFLEYFLMDDLISTLIKYVPPFFLDEVCSTKCSNFDDSSKF